jgi:hypothetical protein
MHTFDLADPVMEQGFEDYLETVKALCRTAGAMRGFAHMTVDEKVIKAGMSQRRPGPHVDGCFMPDVGRWGGGWNHNCNNIANGEAFKRMSIIVAASVAGCKAWKGQYEVEPTDSGALPGIELDAGEVIPAGVGYLLSPDCVHESMTFDRDTQRTFLRIALPTDFAFDGAVDG